MSRDKDLGEEFARLGVREEDLIETFIRSGGPGGQNVNKTSTCVYLKHIPTGIEVKCQKERSQALNRCVARKLLIKKIEARILARIAEEKHRAAKIKRQKRRRTRSLKLKILEEKRKHSQKKRMRVKIRSIDLE